MEDSGSRGTGGCGEWLVMNFPHALSGGQRQRVAITRALIRRTRIKVRTAQAHSTGIRPHP